MVHVQGPAIADTYIQAGSSATARKKGGEGVPLPLGLELPRVHFQLKRLGSRGFALEVGVLDLKGREGVIRCSTFQVSLRNFVVASWEPELTSRKHHPSIPTANPR